MRGYPWERISIEEIPSCCRPMLSDGRSMYTYLLTRPTLLCVWVMSYVDQSYVDRVYIRDNKTMCLHTYMSSCGRNWMTVLPMVGDDLPGFEIWCCR